MTAKPLQPKNNIPIVKRKLPPTVQPELKLKRTRVLPPGLVEKRKPTLDVYGEQWMDKQERSFLVWMNHEFQRASVISNVMEASMAKSSLQYFTICMEYERVRSAATKLFRSTTIQQALCKVSDAIDRNRFKVRSDSDFASDYSVRKQLSDMIASYDTRWLALASDVLSNSMSGKSIAMQHADTIASHVHTVSEDTIE
jgi:hypothetical protein